MNVTSTTNATANIVKQAAAGLVKNATASSTQSSTQSSSSSAMQEASETAQVTQKEAARGDMQAKRKLARMQQQQQLASGTPTKEPGKGDQIDQKA